MVAGVQVSKNELNDRKHHGHILIGIKILPPVTKTLSQSYWQTNSY